MFPKFYDGSQPQSLPTESRKLEVHKFIYHEKTRLDPQVRIEEMARQFVLEHQPDRIGIVRTRQNRRCRPWDITEEMKCTVALHFANGGGIDTRSACRDTMRKGCEDNDGRLETVLVAVE